MVEVCNMYWIVSGSGLYTRGFGPGGGT